MSIEAEIIADSIGPNEKRITTFVLKYPRYIHAELMTHRMFSRNASSSRAQPCKKIRRDIRENMVIPVHFGKNKRGMQAGQEVSPLKKKLALLVWKASGHTAIFASYLLDKLGVHKQITNRVSEPWAHITVLVTATEFNNFFALRYHKDAQPEIFELAKKMYETYKKNVPDLLEAGEWHLPFIKGPMEGTKEELIKRSVARCARVSYDNHDGSQTTLEQDLKLYDRLVGGSIKHSSPCEHQAMAQSSRGLRSGNFSGWIQYRKTIGGENIKNFEPRED